MAQSQKIREIEAGANQFRRSRDRPQIRLLRARAQREDDQPSRAAPAHERGGRAGVS